MIEAKATKVSKVQINEIVYDNLSSLFKSPSDDILDIVENKLEEDKGKQCPIDYINKKRERLLQQFHEGQLHYAQRIVAFKRNLSKRITGCN